MKLEQKITAGLQQKLILTPQLKQSLQILQLPLIELKALVENELMENPLLEEESLKTETPSQEKPSSLEETEDTGYPDAFEERISSFSHSMQIDEEEKRAFAESSIKQPLTLQDHLIWQLKLSTITPEEEKIGETIIGNIDENGYLVTPVNEISRMLGASEEKTEEVLKIVQEFDPPGVGARDLKECLLIQLKALDRDTSVAEKLIENYLTEIEKKKWQEAADSLNLPLSKIKEEVHFISMLEPKPGRKFSLFSPQTIIPDVTVRKVGEQYQAFLNNEYIPRLRLNPNYRNILEQSKDPSSREFIEKKFQAAKWIIKNIAQRQETLIKITEAIVEYQRDFIEKGIDYLKPCTLDNIADKIDMHKSTVSRAINQKYVDIPRGTFEFKAFFSKGFSKDERERFDSSQKLASKTIRSKIETLIENEDPSHPLSDEELKEKLAQGGIPIARRTIAKYREALRILPTHLRKK